MGGGGSKSKKVIKETVKRNEVNTITNTRNEKNVLDQKDVINRIQKGDRAQRGIVQGKNSVNSGYAVYGLMDLYASGQMRPHVCLPGECGMPSYGPIYDYRPRNPGYNLYL